MIGQHQHQQTTMSVATLKCILLALMAVVIMAATAVSTTTPAEARMGHPKLTTCSKATTPPPYCT